jgi:hypothetical protein
MKKRITLIMIAMLAISGLFLVPISANADTLIQKLWIRMRGFITQWGSTPAFGWMGAHVKMVNDNGTHHEWATAFATWSYDKPRLNCTTPPKENFTFTYYTARLVNSSEINLNGTDYDLSISGLWNVNNITTTVLVDENGTFINCIRVITPVVTEAQGELHAFSYWHNFELNITGINLLSGFLVGHVIAYKEIRFCDVNDDGKVDLIDIVKVAKRYRTVPGLFNYDPNMDFNGDGRIDMGDLTTLAANIG